MTDNFIRPEDVKIDIEEIKKTLNREIRDVYKHENPCCELDVEQAEETLKALEQQQAIINKQGVKIYLAIDAIASHHLNPDSAIDYIAIAEMHLKGKNHKPESIIEKRNRLIKEMIITTGKGVAITLPKPPEKEKSCINSCSQSDYYKGGKCDKNGCYKKPPEGES